MSCDKHIHLCKPNPHQDIQSITQETFLTLLPNQSLHFTSQLCNHCSNFSFLTWVLPILEFYISGNILYVLFCVRLLWLSIISWDSSVAEFYQYVYLLIAEYEHFDYPFFCWWTKFCLLSLKLLHFSKSLSMDICFHLFWAELRGQSLGHHKKDYD